MCRKSKSPALQPGFKTFGKRHYDDRCYGPVRRTNY
jgi:hypothetical protein